jgi:succinate-semialdehyde dehydrogenase/glutarate-semialdehyde dehydrogenase
MEMFIDGHRVPASDGARQSIVNPATGAVIDTVPMGSAADADRAIRAASRCLEAWRHTPVSERARLQKRAAQLMRDRAAEIGRVLTTELGRPLAGSIAEIERAADLLDVYAEEGNRIRGELLPGGGPGEQIVVTREPVGVVVAITPFNYPVMLLAFKLGAALIAGCTIVAKPAEDTPLSTLMLAGVFHEAGFPAGCFNVVTGSGAGIGAALVAHPLPRKIAFTGGTAAGRAIAAQAAASMKRLTLELGGQSAAIVCRDADIDLAAAAIARHGFANSGQFCYRVNRVYVQTAICVTFLEALRAHVARLDVGDGLTSPCALGPLVNERIFQNCEMQIADAKAKGARVVAGGSRLAGGIYDGGWFLPPTVIADTDHSMLVMTEETFGPVLGVMAFDTVNDALRLANDSRYGLAGFVFSRDLATALTIAAQFEAGSVWINNIHRSSHHAPFGGIKGSGIGREKGRYGVEAYLEYKTTYVSYDAILS